MTDLRRESRDRLSQTWLVRGAAGFVVPSPGNGDTEHAMEAIGWRVQAVRRLVAMEGLDAGRLAVRSGWPVAEVDAVLDGSRTLTVDEATDLFACFAVDEQLSPWSPEVAETVVRARSLTPGERYQEAVRLARFFAGVEGVGPTSVVAG